MEERKITEFESIEIITSMISRTKDRLVKGSGNILLMWGYLIVAVTALIWVLLVTTPQCRIQLVLVPHLDNRRHSHADHGEKTAC